MKNILIDLERFNIQHFVTKSFVTCDFDEDEFRVEYYVYFKISETSRTHPKNINSLSEKDKVGFSCKPSFEFPELKHKLLTKKEIRFFIKNESSYLKEIQTVDGSVYVNKKVGFIKKLSANK
jgi:hypothetical protein